MRQVKALNIKTKHSFNTPGNVLSVVLHEMLTLRYIRFVLVSTAHRRTYFIAPCWMGGSKRAHLLAILLK